MKILIIGANRGIGLELCRQYKELGHEVFATCRKKTSDLENLDVKIFSNIDVGSFDHLKNLATLLGERSLDLMIHNSGIWRTENLDSMIFETMEEQFKINTLGPLKSIMALKNCLKKGAKIGVVSSRMGSISDNSSGGRYGYRMSKCALNMGMKSMSIDLFSQELSLAILHPGFVRTDMTEGQGDINTDQSVRGLIKCMNNLSLELSGKFWHYSGSELPW